MHVCCKGCWLCVTIFFFRYTKYLYPMECKLNNCEPSSSSTAKTVLDNLCFFRYTKYLYPMECKLNNFSSTNDLQSAIEGNKREGRTSAGGYGPYSGMGLPFQNSPLPPSMGGMPQFSLMGTPPRPLHLNSGSGRPMQHPGKRYILYTCVHCVQHSIVHNYKF